MNRNTFFFFTGFGLCLILGLLRPIPGQAWDEIDTGLFLNAFDPPAKGLSPRACKITVLKIDPARYKLKLLSASEQDNKPRTIKAWCRQFNLLAAINASMYQADDPLRSTGFMKNGHHVNNPRINQGFGAFLLFHPLNPSLPEVQLIDRRIRQDWRALIKKYGSVVQNYRMISGGKPRGWKQQDTAHGSAVIAMDSENHLLFILNPNAYSVYDFIQILINLPLSIDSAMYVEGGSEAELFIRTGSKELDLAGTCGADLTTWGRRQWGGTLPNVLGIQKKE